MGVNHSCPDIFVAQQFLDCSDVVARLEQVRGERMAKCMAADMLDHAGLADGFLHGPLENGLVDMVATLLAGFRVFPPVFLWVRKALISGSPMSAGWRTLWKKMNRLIHPM